MEHGSKQGGDALPIEALERIEEVCRRFEEAWKRGEEPSIERSLAGVAGIERAVLLREIILLDIDYRRRRGEAPIVDDYRRLLPADLPEVDAVFALPEAARPPARRAHDEDPSRLLGTMVGSAKLLQLAGRGGAGDVYIAAESSFHGLVVVKIVAPGGDPTAVLRRFDEARSRLEQVRHPSIARTLSAGFTADGRAYFAGEHVPGESITRYSDRHRLGIRERLKLFLQVCGAVEHAHEKGLIHGSLKPSNVLVLLNAGRPLPRVTDLAVARATRSEARRRAVSAAAGHVPGHAEYTSPEEAENADLELEAPSDVYSLGVILYEILTGKVPFSRREMRRSGYAEILRIIREREPPAPSARLIASRGALERAADLRMIKPARLLRELRADLDWVVMKAIEKKAGCRYATVRDLGTDVARYLRSEPVRARPPGLGYAAWKLARRLASRWWRF